MTISQRHAYSELRELLQSGILHPPSVQAEKISRLLARLGKTGIDSGILFMIKAHLLGCWAPLLAHGRKHVQALTASKASLLALAITEPESGSDIYAMSTCASERETKWVLHGKKIFVTNAPLATHLLVLAKTKNKSSTSSRALSCFLVPRRARGVTVRTTPPLIGLNKALVGEIQFHSVALSKESVVGQLHRGAEFFRTAMLWERSLMFADIPARLAHLRQQTARDAGKKVRNGAALLDNPEFQNRLAAVDAAMAQIQSITATAAAALDGVGNPIRASLQAKLIGSVQYENASRTLLQLGGASACLRGSEFEENFRNSVLSSIYSGPNELLVALLEAVA